MTLDLAAVMADLDSLRARFGTIEDPSVLELVEAMRTALEELRVAQEDLARQDDELQVLQLAMANNAERYRTLFDLAPAAYVTTNRFGVITEANAASGSLLEIETRFLPGKPLPLFVDLRSRRHIRSLALQLAPGATTSFRARVVRRSGVPFDAVLQVAASNHDEIRWVIEDVTADHQAEQRLWELNTELERRVDEQSGELETVLEQLPLGVLIVDAASRGVRRINRLAHKILGGVSLSGEDGIDRLDRRRLDGTPLPRDEWAVTRALAGETVLHELNLLHLPDGRQPIVEIDATPIRGADGNVKTVVLTFDDVTQRERREQADRDFVSNAAHQLRTPLTAIASAVAVLQSGAKEIPEERDRFLAHLERETDRLARLGRALLTLARAQRGESPPDVSVVALRPLLDTLVHDAPTRDGLQIEVRCDPDVAALANAELLEEALSNVLANAIAYTDRGEIAVDAVAVDGTTTITVTDSGPGIAQEEQPRVFDRFYRVSNERQNGFGLGLPIAKAAVEAMDGSIEVLSAPDEGTTIRVGIPAARLLR